MKLKTDGLKTQLAGLPAKKKIAGSVLIMTGFAVLFWFAVIASQQDQISALKADLQREQQAVKRLEEYAKQHPQGDVYLAELEQKISEVNSLLPDGGWMGRLLIQVDEAATGSGVELVSMKPQQVINGKGVRAYPFELVLRGSKQQFSGVLEFVVKLHSLTRYANIVSISTELQQNMLETKILLLAYSFGQVPNPTKPEQAAQASPP
ncbi:type 4a pilus biogenesis protein PilO|uniref:Tfp pilus assembly protein PilO n=1 Tax=Dendrosporobacter quercicolus TaxID=146817 RepID=A0A1G9M7V6_9FIRM|nr:type 4a pilus biogenesis protein PilO [Dendrosporobacter quercicolus]NSL46949.1 type 4a pilus biogenesis protein PilO [Dendrosporobacter quercicolus DSM 1736]SDL70183.1 Tfp pilus assembly protein PilO [Dendrosporobacter quercicolus]